MEYKAKRCQSANPELVQVRAEKRVREGTHHDFKNKKSQFLLNTKNVYTNSQIAATHSPTPPHNPMHNTQLKDDNNVITTGMPGLIYTHVTLKHYKG